MKNNYIKKPEEILQELRKRIRTYERVISEITSSPLIDSGEIEKIANHIMNSRCETDYLEDFLEERTEKIRKEDALMEEHERNRFIAENAGDVIWLLDLTTGRFKYVSPSVERLRGFTQEEVMKQSIKEVLTDESYRFVSENLPGVINEFLAGNTSLRVMTHELDQRCKNGSIVNTEVVVTLLKNNQEQVTELLGITRDITERKKAERELRRKTEELEKFFNSSLDLLAIADNYGYFRRLNPEWEKVLGYDLEELEGHKFIDFVHREDREATIEAEKILIEQKKVGPFVNRYRTKDDSYRWIEWKSYPEGNLFYCAARDITERKEMEEALKESEAKYRIIVDTACEGIWMMNDKFETVFVNSRMTQILGYTVDEMMGKNVSIFMYNEELEEHHKEMEERKKGIPRQYVRRYTRKDGEIIWLFTSATPIFDREGNFSGSFAMLTDITDRVKAEEALRKSEEKYRKIFEDAVEGIFQTTPEGRYITVNPSFAKMFGFSSPEEMISSVKNIGEELYVNPEDRLTFRRLLEENDRITGWEVMLYTKGRKKIWNSINAHTVRDKNGRILYYEGTNEDITVKKEMEEALKDSEEKYRRIIDTSCEGIWMMNGDLETTFVNSRMAEIFGYSAGEMLGKNISAFMFSEELEDHYKKIADRKKGLSQRYIRRFIRKDSQTIWLLVSATPVFDRERNFAGSFAMVTDITELIKIEEALRKSEEKYRKIFENTVEGIFQTTPEGKFITVNPSLAKMFGYSSPEEIISFVNDIGYQIYVNPGDRLRFKETLAKNNKITGFEIEAYKKNGQKVWHSLNAYTVRDEKSNILYYEGTCEDITARKKMEEALKIEKAKLEIASLAGKVGLWTWHIETGIIEWSSAIQSMLGYNVTDLSGNISLWKDIIHRDDRERVMVSLNNHLKENTRYRIDYRIRRYDGTYIWWLVTGSSERDSNGHAIKMSGACVDITERKVIEEELMKTRALFKAALEQSPVGITIVDWPDMKFCMVNNRATKITGIRHGDYMNISGKRIDTDSWELFYPDGRKCGIKDFPLTKSILNGEFIKDQLMIIKRTSGISRYILVSSAPVFNDCGDIIAGICIFPDVTDARKAEKEKLEMEKKLLHAQKLESLGVMAGGIAHDFNNLLMALLGNLELARMDISPFSPAVTYIDGALQTSRRAADLTRQMLAYSGKGKFVITPINLNELVEENYHLFKASLSKSAILKLEMSPCIPGMEGDPGQIQQIIMNLITNASEAIGDKSGIITLATGMEHCDKSYLEKSRLEEIPPEGAFVYIEVKDTGCGMDKETQDRLFDPFFTTKFTGRGLGMSAVMGIIKSHRGAIIVDSVRGMGTSIKVFFPACNYDAGTDYGKEYHATQVTVPLKTMDGTILLVDDEDIILATSEIILRRLGFKVITASDGEKAIKIFSEQPDKIDCIIMDLSMPKMDGLTAFKKIIDIKRDVKIILSSGYNEEAAVREHTGGLAGFLEKPYQIEDLQKILQKTLG